MLVPMQHSLLPELQIAHTLIYILGLTSTCTHCSKSAAAFAYAKQPSEMVATSPPNDNKQPSQSVTKQTRTDNSSSSTSSSAAPSGLTGSNYASLNDDPDNLRKEQEHELSPAQRAALLQLRAGKENDTVSLDANNRVWYQPNISPEMKRAA